MTGEEIHIVVRKPLADIEQDVRRKFGVATALLNASLEPDALVLTFSGIRQAKHSQPLEIALGPNAAASVGTGVGNPGHRRRSKKRARQRTKTRGWDVVGKFVNSKGLRCTIYRPMYDALRGKKIRRREAYSAIRQILMANGNNPKPSTVEYFLDNTLEFLSQSRQPEAGGPVEGDSAIDRSRSGPRTQPLEQVKS
jgi:hypothetical protein